MPQQHAIKCLHAKWALRSCLMARELIKVGLSGRRGDSPYSSSTKVVQRREQVGSLVAVPTPSGNPIIFPHTATSHQCSYKAAAAYKLKYGSLLPGKEAQRSMESATQKEQLQENIFTAHAVTYCGFSDVINVILALADTCGITVGVVHHTECSSAAGSWICGCVVVHIFSRSGVDKERTWHIT